MTDAGAAGPVAGLKALVARGDLRPDPLQRAAAERLQGLYEDLRGYRPAPPPPERKGLLGRLGFGGGRREAPPPVPSGLYLFGPVGRGKSMLMDLFFDTAPVQPKRRVHFHAFMQEVQERVHARRQSGAEGDPIPDIARDVAEQATLLCFDEFQVENIADAMILGRLFQALFDRGVVVVATSNVEPQNLYKDGLQRERFLPFIALIQERLSVFELESETDYRLDRLKGRPTYHTPLDEAATEALDRAFRDLTDDAPPHAETLKVRGRKLTAPVTAKGVARFTFEDLCARPLGAADYLAIAARFHTVILDGIPVLPPEKRNEAKRFVTLIDALYEAKTNLICSAAALPQALNPEGETSFAFQRTVSRLMEMQADDYIAARRPTEAPA
ncbi:MAG: AFG1 family ATPase [Alphaproteobacteria bacterium]|nr:AFG1 family ATPase [Alphaproteobacteria bacterium]MCB9928720.1 cell division protein ZapE [Alphaproteobacteria bacterium]